MTAFGSNCSTPGGWHAQANKGRGGFSETGAPRYGGTGVSATTCWITRSDDDVASPAGATASPPPRGRVEGGAAARRRAAPRDPSARGGEIHRRRVGFFRVFHQNGQRQDSPWWTATSCTIVFDKAGEKWVVEKKFLLREFLERFEKLTQVS